CDGWATVANTAGRQRGQIAIALGSEGMIRDIEWAMLRLGIVGRIRRKIVRGPSGREFRCWEWAVFRGRDLIQFADDVGMYGKENAVAAVRAWATQQSEAKKQKWQWLELPEGYRWERIASIEPVGDRPTVAISVAETHTFITTFVEHNTFVAA